MGAHRRCWIKEWLFVTAILGSIAPQVAAAANYTKMLNVNPPTAQELTVSGFFIPAYEYTGGTSVPAGNPPSSMAPNLNLVPPNFTSDSSFNIPSAQLHFAGNINKNASYFVNAEFGNTPYNYVGGNYSPHILDARITMSYLPGARIEVGDIRAPGPMDAMKPYMKYNFLFYPTIISSLMLQPFYAVNQTYAGVGAGGYTVPGADVLGNNFYRYQGAQVFDSFRRGPWESTYAVMAANYGPLSQTNTGRGLLTAELLQESYVLGGHGPFRSDITVEAWHQHADPYFNQQSYSLDRRGIGASYASGFMQPGGRTLRFEYMGGSGMITVPATFSANPALSAPQYSSTVYPTSDNTAHGYYIEGGYFVTKHLEVNLRYDYYDLLPNIAASERTFHTKAVGLQYRFNPLDSILLNYYIRAIGIPNPGAIPAAQRSFAESVVNSADNQIVLWGIVSF